MSATTVPPVRLGAADRLRSLARGRPEDPAWVRPGIAAALALAALLCLWDLTASGYSNTYYAAAAKAGSESWKAWFFGSLDPGSFITVDKPPLSLWLMGLSARVLGFSSFSLLLPQALARSRPSRCCTRRCGACSRPPPACWPPPRWRSRR